jgi:hypothetical protein
MTRPCAETVELHDDRVLTCDLPDGHPGPVHSDGQESWADPMLPEPPSDDDPEVDR